MNRKLKLGIALTVASSVIAGGVAAAASSPSVSTGSATPGTSSATLHGTINPNGSSTTYFFSYGPAKGVYTVNTPVKALRSGTAPKSVEAKASGLLPGTTYHYRLTATNRFGTSQGADRSLTTTGHPPALATTQGVAALTATAATLTGVINPNGEKTNYYFEYGTSTAYTARTPTSSVAAGKAPVSVSALATPLTPLTVFHFQLVAFHGSIASPGGDQTFLTYPSPRPVPRVAVRTTPRRDRHRPYVFNTFGRLVRPSIIPPFAGYCVGDVALRYFLGRHEVSFTLVPVQPNCTFFAQTGFRHFPGRGKHRRSVTLHVRMYFRGNGFLAPVNVKPAEKVILGSG
jgi:hypothetical protein